MENMSVSESGKGGCWFRERYLNEEGGRGENLKFETWRVWLFSDSVCDIPLCSANEVMVPLRLCLGLLERTGVG